MRSLADKGSYVCFPISPIGMSNINSAITIANILFCAISFLWDFEPLVLLSAIKATMRFAIPKPKTDIAMATTIMTYALLVMQSTINKSRMGIHPHG